MRQYPKQILTVQQQIQTYIDSGMEIASVDEVEKALKTVGYYRLRGYSFQLYDNASKKYLRPTDDAWNEFTKRLKELLDSNKDCVNLSAMNFPEDWESHMMV